MLLILNLAAIFEIKLQHYARKTDRQTGRQIVAERGEGVVEREKISTYWDMLRLFTLISRFFSPFSTVSLGNWAHQVEAKYFEVKHIHDNMYTAHTHTHAHYVNTLQWGRVSASIVYVYVYVLTYCHLQAEADSKQTSELQKERKFREKRENSFINIPEDCREPWHGTNALIGMKLDIAKFGEAEELIFQNIRLLACPLLATLPTNPPPPLPTCSSDSHSSLSFPPLFLSRYIYVAQSHSISVANVCVYGWVEVCLRSHMNSTYFVQTHQHQHSPCVCSINSVAQKHFTLHLRSSRYL